MKIVSFNIAKILKESGYPQPQTDVWGYVNHPNNCYFTGCHSYFDENRERRLEWDETNEFHTANDWADEIEPSFYGSAIAAPTYMETWRWLWQEKGIQIPVGVDSATIWIREHNGNMYNHGVFKFNNDPEEAIMEAIKYLVNNDLIK